MSNTADLVSGVLEAIGGIRAVFNGLDRLRTGANRSLNGLGRAGASSRPVVRTGKRPVAKSHRIPDAIEHRVRLIKQKIQEGKRNPQIRGLAAEILNRKCGEDWCVPQKDWDAEVKAVVQALSQDQGLALEVISEVFGETQRAVRYTRDIAEVDTYQSPQRTLEWGIGDCDDYTIVVASLLGSIGFPVTLRIMRTRGANGKPAAAWNHILPLVGLPPRAPVKWMPLDASVSKPAGWYPPKSMIAAVRDFRV